MDDKARDMMAMVGLAWVGVGILSIGFWLLGWFDIRATAAALSAVTIGACALPGTKMATDETDEAGA